MQKLYNANFYFDKRNEKAYNKVLLNNYCRAGAVNVPAIQTSGHAIDANAVEFLIFFPVF